MIRPVRIVGIGAVVERRAGPDEAGARRSRVAALLAALAREEKRVRLFHPIEEVALLAARDALTGRETAIPPGEGEGIGIALGVDEGIDGIKADHGHALLREGPLGASPLTFPFTAPNAVTAQLSIALDIRGETFTVCGGRLSGAGALGLAVDVLRRGRAPAMLAGGATSVGKAYLDGLSAAGIRDDGPEREGACILFLAPEADGRGEADGGAPRLLGYGEGFGDRAVRYAVEACLEEASVSRREVDSIWDASPGGRPSGEPFPFHGGGPSPRPSPGADLHSASFPSAIAAAARGPAGGKVGLSLVVGTDCLGGAAAALVRCGA